MADVGSIVTDAEVLALVPTIKTIDTRAKLIIQGAERAVTRHCKRSFASAPVAYSSESIDIFPGSIFYDMQVVQPRLEFRVKHYPVSQWNSLKHVTARDATTGQPTPEGLVLIPRDSYVVDLETGIVHMISTAWTMWMPEAIWALGMQQQSVWPAGIDIMRADYIAGVNGSSEATAVEIADLKLIVMRVIARVWTQFDQNTLNIASRSGEFGNDSYVNVILTEDEKKALNPFKKWVLC